MAFLVTLPIEVKTYDVDFAGIVHNMVYIRWLEDLRTEMLADSLPISKMLEEGISPILTRTAIDYLRPLRLGVPALGRMWITELGRTRWKVRGQIESVEGLAVDATQTGYFADLATLRPIRIPKILRAMWEERTGSGPTVNLRASSQSVL